MLQDIAVLTGGTVITQDAGLSLENIQLSLLGQARRVIINKDSTTIVGDGLELEAIKIRCEQLRHLELAMNSYDISMFFLLSSCENSFAFNDYYIFQS